MKFDMIYFDNVRLPYLRTSTISRHMRIYAVAFVQATSTFYSVPKTRLAYFHRTLAALPELVLLLLLLPSIATSLTLLAILGVTGAL